MLRIKTIRKKLTMVITSTGSPINKPFRVSRTPASGFQPMYRSSCYKKSPRNTWDALGRIKVASRYEKVNVSINRPVCYVRVGSLNARVVVARVWSDTALGKSRVPFDRIRS